MKPCYILFLTVSPVSGVNGRFEPGGSSDRGTEPLPGKYPDAHLVNITLKSCRTGIVCQK